MNTQILTYDQPREKLQMKGVSVLTNAELLQVIIGSGNAQASVSRIAKRSLKLLSQYGNEITYAQLLEVAGLGPARVCQIIAAFELASRYPMRSQQLVIDTPDKIQGLCTELRSLKATRLIYITVDGGKRLICKRTIAITDLSHPSSLLRKIFTDVSADNAAGLIIGVGKSDRNLQPSMFDLSLARDLKSMAQLFMVTIHDHLIINATDHRSLKREIW